TPPQRSRAGANRIGTIAGVIGGAIGICVGGAAALLALFPSTALWMSPLVCRSPYQLDYSTSHYSYRPGQSGTSVSFQWVRGAAFSYADRFCVDGLHSILIALILGAAVFVIGLIRRRLQKPGA